MKRLIRHKVRPDQAATNSESPLLGIAAFQRFQEGIADRCAEGPTVTDLTEVGSCGVFG